MLLSNHYLASPIVRHFFWVVNMKNEHKEGFDPDFPFSDDILLSNVPMTDDEFAKFMVIKNDEIPIEKVTFDLSIHLLP